MDINYLTIFILQFTNEQFVKVTILLFDEANPLLMFCRRLLVFIFFMTVLSTYRLQTAVLFQRPCCFNSSKPIPFAEQCSQCLMERVSRKFINVRKFQKCSYEAWNRCHTIHSNRLFAKFTSFCSRLKQSSIFCFN